MTKIIMGSIACVIGVGYFLNQYRQSLSVDNKEANYYKKSICEYIINNLNSGNNTVSNIIITYSSSINIDAVEKTAKFIYSNITHKVNIYSIEYSEIEHFNDSKDKSTFDAIILIDDYKDNITISTHSSQSTISNLNLRKFSKISSLLKPSCPFLTFYYQQPTTTTTTTTIQQQFNEEEEEEDKQTIETNEIVTWDSKDIFKNQKFYELCGFKVESINSELLGRACVVAKSPNWSINSIDNLRL